jgi:hypothetical protein
MARQTSTQAETRDDWQRLIPPLVANAADLPHLEAPTAQLGSIVTQTGDLLEQQAALAASKQEVSRRLQALVSDGRRLAAFLRAGVKQRYGARSEKLAAFNLQPFRGRKAAKPAETVTKLPAATSTASGSETTHE